MTDQQPLTREQLGRVVWDAFVVHKLDVEHMGPSWLRAWQVPNQGNRELAAAIGEAVAAAIAAAEKEEVAP